MKKMLLTVVLCLCITTLFAQRKKRRSAVVYGPVNYTVSFPNAIHHEAEIAMTLTQVPKGPLRVRMSRSSPGRYATHEFGKNIYNLKAFGPKGETLAIKQLEGDVYEIPLHSSEVNITYTLFGNWVDGTYAGIDRGQAHLNMPATFMWAPGFENRRIRIQFIDADKHAWRVSTQLKNEGDNIYSAPNLQYMMDSPTELSAFKQASWQVTNPSGKKQTINLHVYSDDSQQTINAFAQKVQRLVLEEQAVYGELPDYDYGEYTFINNVHSTVNGDGMEHRNSTIITDPIDSIGGNETDVLGTYAHEYFHSWNVERIRPKSLEPFNFTHANQSSELWFAEGFTQYYGDLMLTRAGLRTLDSYTDNIGWLINQVINTPGAQKYPPVQMSRYAVFADAGVSIDANNNTNIFTSYYTYGGATALALDLRLRGEFHLSLDDYMRFVWQKYGKTGKPYTVPLLQLALAQLTKEPAFASDFFKQYIYGVKKNDYAALLTNAGLEMRKANPGQAWAGALATPGGRGRSGMAHSSSANDGLLIVSSTAEGTPYYQAGLDAGDIILTADGQSIKDYKTLQSIITAKKPGDKVTITYKNRSGNFTTDVLLQENPYIEVVTFEKAGKTPTSAQIAFRNNWLQSKVK